MKNPYKITTEFTNKTIKAIVIEPKDNQKSRNSNWQFIIKNKTWILGIFLILSALNYFQYNFIGGIFALLAGILTLPPVYFKVKEFYQTKYNFNFTKLISSGLIFLLFVIGLTITSLSSEPIRKIQEEKLAKEKTEKIEQEKYSQSIQSEKKESEKKQAEEAKAKSEADKKVEDEKKKQEEQQKKELLATESKKIEYNIALKKSTDLMSENLGNFAILKTKPALSLLSNDEIIELAASSLIIENEYDTFIKNVPSENFLTTHELYIEALRNYKLAMPLFRRGIDNKDSKLIEESNQYIKTGNDYIQKALTEAKAIN